MTQSMQQGFVHGGPRLLLRIEGLAYAALALIGYAYSGYSWWLFAALILVPDVSMLGYLINPSIGRRAITLCTRSPSRFSFFSGPRYSPICSSLRSARSGSFILGPIAHSATGSNTQQDSAIRISAIQAEASRKPECLLLAQSGHFATEFLRVKRTCVEHQ
jgi:hypothetical protein